MVKVIVGFVLIILTSLYVVISVQNHMRTERNDVDIKISDTEISPMSVTVAVFGDAHVGKGAESLAAFRELILEIKNAQPDLILLTGDYIDSPSRIVDINTHREQVIQLIKLITSIPSVVVLGNYETWSDADKWYDELTRAGVNVLENEVDSVVTRAGMICVRGLGDQYSGRYRHVEFPPECADTPKITITHDPAAAFHPSITGLVVAGHTHCGQISLPLLGILWAPTEAPVNGRCGLYADQDRTLFVTSGVGTSILPIRFGAQSQWDFINVRFEN